MTIVILSDKPSVNRKFVVTLNMLTTQSTTAASGMYMLLLQFIIIRSTYIIFDLVADFVNTSSEVEFSANQTEAYVLVYAQEDLMLETNEEFIVKLELMEEDRMVGVRLSEHYDSATVTIINDNGIQHLCLIIYVVTYCLSL